MIWTALLLVATTVNADTPPPTKPRSASIAWDEARVSKKIARWKNEELLIAQVVFRVALEGENHCGFPPEYLTAAPQLFQGELESRSPKPDHRVCGKPITDLSSDEAHACAKRQASRICNRLR